MHKRWMALLMALVLLVPAMAAAHEKRVFRAEETQPFAENEELLILRVAPLMGADSMLLTCGEHSMLVDMGLREHINEVLRMLEDAGLKRVEYAFSTHPHLDHLGGMIPLINAGIQFDQFLTAYPHNYMGQGCIQRSSVQAVKQAGIPVTDIADGDIIPFGDAEIMVLRQTANKKDNETSAMLMIRYGECSLLLTADVSGEGQPVLAKMHDLKADIMKYPHHGLNRLHKDFLKETDPELTFIPHGAINSKDAQAQMRNAGIQVMFANWGPITLKCNGEKWIVDQYLSESMKIYAEQHQLKN